LCFLFCLSSTCVWCAQYCQYFWFSLMVIYMFMYFEECSGELVSSIFNSKQ
jgi:hypothetical protein